ncbi:MAG: DEAD/DEAH box helicase [Myxococcota bacterium]
MVPRDAALPVLLEPSRTILDVLAVCHGDITPTNLCKVLAALKSRAPNGKAWTAPFLAPFLAKLGEDGHITQPVRPRCAAHLREPVVRELVAGGSFEATTAAVLRALPEPAHARLFRDRDEVIRALRTRFYTEGQDATAAAWDEWGPLLGGSPLLAFLTGPGSAPLDALTPALFDRLAREVYRDSDPIALSEEVLAARVAIRARMPAHLATASDPVRTGWADDLWWRGLPDEAEATLRDIDTPAALVVRARVKLGRGAFEEARATFERAEKARGKTPPSDTDALLYIAALLAIGSAEALQRAQTWLARPDRAGAKVFQDLAHVPAHLASGAAPAFSEWISSKRTDITALFEGLARVWVNAPVPKELAARIATFGAKAEASGLTWASREAAALRNGGTSTLRALVRAREPWRMKLEALARVVAAPAPVATPAPEAKGLRMVWFLTLHGGTTLLFAPREQKASGTGWTGGRPIALKRLHEGLADFDYVTEQDRKVIAHIKRHAERNYSGYEEVTYSFNEVGALLALVGHPLLVWADSGAPVSLGRGEPALVIERSGADIVVRLDPPASSLVAVRRVGPDALELVILGDTHRQVAKVLEGELRLPASAEAELRAVVETLSAQVSVHAGLRGWGARSVPANASPIAQLSPAGAGLRVRFVVRPLGAAGPVLPLGEGAATVLSRQAGEPVQAERDLAEEGRVLAGLVEACPSLRGAGGSEWTFEDDDASLSALLDLGRLGDAVALEWPATMPVRRVHELGPGALHLQVKKDGEWFAASGSLRFDETTSFELEALLALMDTSPGRFVRLGDGRFAALTEGFRERLELLRRSGSLRGGKLRFHPLVAPVVDELTAEGGTVGADAAFRALVKRIATAEAATFDVPSTLAATLRPYQVDGYRWLCRLAERGAGACLADDMGVGKTLQTLTLLLRRAPDGPALVIAPTSVCGGWLDEALRFAPTLDVRRFGDGDRDATLAAAGPFTVLVCSYGLLQSEVDRLAAQRWHTLVLDEGQQIKNSGTQRFKAAVRLDADFRVICSGTPVENHLGELWSLLRFLNPGLLGTEAEFRTRFQLPIERDHDPHASAALRRIVRPFILRRTKADVLRELPPRTEVTLRVELSAEEAALYEALRRRALDALTAAADRGPTWRFRVLAEITRLRQAACNVRLVLDDGAADAPSSAKLAALTELVDTLRAGGHKALVFSQFVRHLALVREVLDARGIAYQYLDGGTSTAERARAVRAFQSGEGDLFLISLKAGGTGLNLTAADYVVHLDPWWNPAVEDQASDRAHRIGQQRPVTIYRMVSVGTIEERIVALHHAKRDLATSLLDGADGRLATEDLLALLAEG